MKTIESVGEASACVLDVLLSGPRSAGNVARKMMGAGLLPNASESYELVKATLISLAALGLVEKYGNGKSVHWRLSKQATRLAGEP